MKDIKEQVIGIFIQIAFSISVSIGIIFIYGRVCVLEEKVAWTESEILTIKEDLYGPKQIQFEERKQGRK